MERLSQNPDPRFLKLNPNYGVTVMFAVFVTVSNFTVNVTAVFADTLKVVSRNVPVVAPSGTTTVAGADAALEFDDVIVIEVPPVGAGPLRFTVPFTTVVEPPTTVVRLSRKFVKRGAEMVSATDFEAVIRATTETVFVTGTALAARTVNVTVLLPAGTVTDGALNSVNVASDDDRVTTVPPVGAFALSVIVPVDSPTVPPTNVVGFNVTLSNPGGLMRREPSTDAPW